MFDLLITGGWVIDGTGAPPFRADVGVTGDRIAALGRLDTAEARTRLEVADLHVAPGFIDAHVHGDLALLADPIHRPALLQGVTTYILGQDGSAFAPGSAATVSYMRRYTAGFNGLYPDLPTAWTDVAGYLSQFDRKTALNVAYLVPNGNLRLEVIGHDPRPATDGELRAMQRLVEAALDAGAVGLSSGLDYIPSRYADTAELAALCAPLVPANAVYVTHMRGYGRMAPAGMVEVCEIARTTGVAAHVSHYNGPAEILLPLIDAGRAQGLDLTFDSYPYLAGSTILGMVALPDWIQEGGITSTLERLSDTRNRDRLTREWFSRPLTHPLEGITLAMLANAEWRWAEGLKVEEAARQANLSICDFICDILLACDLAVGVIAHRGSDRTEADVASILRHPAHMAGSDGIFSGSKPHPRGWGAFARYLGHHTRERRDYTWGEAGIHLASHAARRFRLLDRGLLRPGFAADLAIYDPSTIADRSTYENGRIPAEGMKHVIVNGTPVLRDGQPTGATPGRALKRG
jgi:N-acyl-D-amino-acid deacylase